MRSIDGQRILLIAPRFFGYERDIATALRARGARVDWLADRPYDTPVMAAATRFAPHVVLPFADRLYRAELETLAPGAYNHILVINGQTVSGGFLRSLRREFPMARLTLYMWDSLDNRRRVAENFELFDRVSSFDPLTVNSYGVTLRPLFYTRVGPPLTTETTRFDASFIGTAHSDRYAVVSRLRDALSPNLRTFWYLYLQARWLYFAYKLTNRAMTGAKQEDFAFDPLDKPRFQEVATQTLAVVDIEHPRQRGLTMRTFETVGLSRKLITTNALIENYDFYDKDNIMVIDRNDPQVSSEFFTSDFRPLSTELLRKYSIDGWIDDVLELG